MKACSIPKCPKTAEVHLARRPHPLEGKDFTGIFGFCRGCAPVYEAKGYRRVT